MNNDIEQPDAPETDPFEVAILSAAAISLILFGVFMLWKG